ncbi:hypothetical protein AGMMS49991_02060 [Spirochaetia bacterium]|nr:hypothetical protein AGMMS49991_02060 [Spirochaetia bacterium]
MQAIEFNSVITNGVIPIPEQYKGKIGNEVKVIAFPEHSPAQEGPVIYPPRNTGPITEANFQAVKIDTRNFVFNRDEANER